MKPNRMTERQVTKAYFSNKISKKQHDTEMHRIMSSRHKADISKKKNRMSMSSNKWS